MTTHTSREIDTNKKYKQKKKKFSFQNVNIPITCHF